MAWGWAAQAAGSGLVVLLLEDIFVTVLVPGRRHGALGLPLNKAIWGLFRLGVYSALVRRDTFGLSLEYRSGATGDPAELLALLGPNGDFSGSRQALSGIGASVLDVFESANTYRVLRYFHHHRNCNALPRILLMALETATLIRSALHPEVYRTLVNSAAVAELWGGGLNVLNELSRSFLPRDLIEETHLPEQEWRGRYDRAAACLRAAGIETEPDREAGVRRYIALRRQWNAPVVALALYLQYEWSAVAPADAGGADTDASATPE